MRATDLWAPLAARSTFRRAVHLILGGVALVPYLLLTVGFAQIFADPDMPHVPIGVLAAVTAAIAITPPFLPTIRALEIAAARNLLGVDLPDPTTSPPWDTRLLGAAWYALHLLLGGAAMLSILFSAPITALLVARGLNADDRWSDTISLAPFETVDGGWTFVVAVGLILATLYLVAGLGALLTKLAPLLLGPSPAELTRMLEAQAEQFAERTRLARELHDSVGHALSVTTLQAAAARRVLDSDPDFANQAMLAIEETGRAAMEDLDHVLGVLRSDVADGTDEAAAPGTASPSPQRTLADVDQLVDDTRATGVDVDLVVIGDLGSVAPATSREAYRIVQEGLTNARRHSGAVPIALRIAADPNELRVELTNPLPDAATTAPRSGGRGLHGMRERVGLLGGQVEAGPDDGYWRVQVHLPVHRPGAGDGAP